MTENSAIGWTTHTFNPWWGCFKVSPGCQNCYAETFSKRTGHDIWGPPKTTSRRFFGDKHWREPMKWAQAAHELYERTGERTRVFCASMADVFEDHPDVWDSRQRLWDVIAETPSLDWLLLTKRPENVMQMVPMDWTQYGFPDNVWLGTSVENQQAADERIPWLIDTPSQTKFLSCEPLLGPVWITEDQMMRLDWIIVGGESGAKHRPMDLAWAKSLISHCQVAPVAVYVKQDSGMYPGRQGRIPDDLWIHQWPATPAPAGPLEAREGA